MICARSGCNNLTQGDLLYCSEACLAADFGPSVTPYDIRQRLKFYCRVCLSDVCENAGHPTKHYPCTGRRK